MTMTIEVRQAEKPSQKTRVYVFHDDETVLDQLVTRYSRPSDCYREKVLPKVDALLQTPPDRWSWSQKAGCGCGCSPGFVASNNWGFDVFVHATDEDLGLVNHESYVELATGD